MKTLSEEIAEHRKGKNQKKSNRNKVIFLSLKEEIEAALDDGWSLLSIWEVLYKKGKIQFKYATFNRHAKEIFGLANNSANKKKTLNTKTAVAVYSRPKENERPLSKEPKLQSSAIQNFEYDPTHSMEKFK